MKKHRSPIQTPNHAIGNGQISQNLPRTTIGVEADKTALVCLGIEVHGSSPEPTSRITFAVVDPIAG